MGVSSDVIARMIKKGKLRSEEVQSFIVFGVDLHFRRRMGGAGFVIEFGNGVWGFAG